MSPELFLHRTDLLYWLQPDLKKAMTSAFCPASLEGFRGLQESQKNALRLRDRQLDVLKLHVPQTSPDELFLLEGDWLRVFPSLQAYLESRLVDQSQRYSIDQVLKALAD